MKDEFQFSQKKIEKDWKFGDSPKPKNRGHFFLIFQSTQAEKILRPKPGYLGVKWTYGEFTKSKYAKSEIQSVPPPLCIIIKYRLK